MSEIFSGGTKNSKQTNKQTNYQVFSYNEISIILSSDLLSQFQIDLYFRLLLIKGIRKTALSV